MKCLVTQKQWRLQSSCSFLLPVCYLFLCVCVCGVSLQKTSLRCWFFMQRSWNETKKISLSARYCCQLRLLTTQSNGKADKIFLLVSWFRLWPIHSSQHVDCIHDTLHINHILFRLCILAWFSSHKIGLVGWWLVNSLKKKKRNKKTKSFNWNVVDSPLIAHKCTYNRPGQFVSIVVRFGDYQ